MKLAQLFTATGEPFIYYPSFVHRFNISVNACVFLCYVVWKTIPEDIEGWRSLSVEKLTKATGLSVKEQATARKQLVAAGLIEEHYARLEHVLKFRLGDVDMEVGDSPNAESADAPRGHTPKEQMGNRSSSVSSINGKEREKESLNKEADSVNLKPATAESDAEWLNGLKASPAYEGIDLDRELAKMQAWCSTNGKQANRRRFVNWINRCDRPIMVNGNGHTKREEILHGEF